MNETIKNLDPAIARVRTRFAPSPTGYLHIGGLRTALFAFLYAKHNNGDFILRVEDTDRARFVEGAIEKLVGVLQTMGLQYDEGIFLENGKTVSKGSYGPYLQSERLEIYHRYAEELIQNGGAYYCFCDEKRLAELRKEQEALKMPTHYDRKCRNIPLEEARQRVAAGEPYVIRQAMPLDGQTVVHDLIFKDIVYENKTLDDQVLLKSDGFPTYHLAVVVDDHLMQISHVIRGDEWIPSTPKHILLYQAFNWRPPQFAHLPLILNKDRSKLSKRQGDVAVEDYLEKGYLKEALINFFAFLGWNPKTDQEIFSLQQLIEQFDLAKVNKAAAVFDIEKLDWFNSVYIRNTDTSKLAAIILPFLVKDGLIQMSSSGMLAKNGKQISKEFLEAIIELEKERLKKFSEIGERVKYFFEAPLYDPQLLIWRKSNLQATRTNLSLLLEYLKDLEDKEFADTAKLETKVKELISQKELDNGSVLWPMRVALSGMEASPGPFQIASALAKGYGKYEVLQRIETAIRRLE